ncbi:MAG: IS110 family transposase [Anaerolineae bacterium]
MHPTTIAGIDIGKQSIQICLAAETPPRKWPTVALDLRAPTWYDELTAHIPPGSLVALEPTGWHYSRPIVLALEGQSCTIIYVNHATTTTTRADHISQQKTDPNDARALALKARELTTHGDLLGCKIHDPAREGLTITLRLLITKHGREMTRKRSALNHIGTFGHGIWPSLDFHKTPYTRAIGAGAITPGEIRALAARLQDDPHALPAYANPRARSALAQLAAELDHAPEPDAGIREAIADAYAELTAADSAIAQVEARITKLVTTDPNLAPLSANWLTIPGASPVRIATIHAAAGCHAEAYTVDQLRAACGCHPCRQESGRVTEAADSKRGYRPAKAALHLWVLYLLSPSAGDNPVRAYFNTLKERGNRNAVHASRGKLIRTLAGIAKHAEPYRNAPARRPVACQP